METIGAEQIVRTAQGISDFGMMAIMAGTFLLLSVGAMIYFAVWVKNVMDDILRRNSVDIKVLIDKQDTQNDLLHEIADGLRPTTLLQIKSISNTCFDLSIEKVCRIIRRVREENHIVDREATRSKIRTLLCNLHEDRNSRWDNIRYHGKTLTQYTSPEWIDWVSEVVEKEVYAESVNNGRVYTNVDAVYSKIRLDFYHKLTGV